MQRIDQKGVKQIDVFQLLQEVVNFLRVERYTMTRQENPLRSSSYTTKEENNDNFVLAPSVTILLESKQFAQLPSLFNFIDLLILPDLTDFANFIDPLQI